MNSFINFQLKFPFLENVDDANARAGLYIFIRRHLCSRKPQVYRPINCLRPSQSNASYGG